jgi:hypothetical protein
MKEYKWLIPVCYVPVAVGGPRNCAHSWDPSLIFDPSFAENQPRMTPKTHKTFSGGFEQTFEQCQF